MAAVLSSNFAQFKGFSSTKLQWFYTVDASSGIVTGALAVDRDGIAHQYVNNANEHIEVADLPADALEVGGIAP